MWASLTDYKIPRTPTTVTFWLTLAAVLTYIVVVFAWDLPTPSRLFWLGAGFVIGVAFHEGGHALCAMLVGIPIRVVSIGTGPLLLHGQIGATKLEWRLSPFGGYAQHYPPLADRRFATAFFFIGGVLGNVLVIAIAKSLSFAASASSPLSTLPGSLSNIIIPQVIMIAVSLYPFRLAKTDNDARLLLQLFRGVSSGSAEVLAAYKRLLDCYRSGSDTVFHATPASSRIAHQLFFADKWAETEARCEWRDALMRELARGNLPPEEEVLVLDALLTYGLVCGDSTLRPYLDEWSVRALNLAPGTATLLGTRGAVLVELGQHEAGKSLLLPLAQDDANANSSDSKFDALISQLFLTRAESALGNVEKAAAMAAAALRTAEVATQTADVRMVMARFSHELQGHSDGQADGHQPVSVPVSTAVCPSP